MRIEFLKHRRIFEFLPAITWYYNDGEYNKGSLSFSWLFWGLQFYRKIK